MGLTPENNPRIPRETAAQVLTRAVELVEKKRTIEKKASEEGGLKLGTPEQKDLAMSYLAAHLLVGETGVQIIETMLESLEEKGKKRKQ